MKADILNSMTIFQPYIAMPNDSNIDSIDAPRVDNTNNTTNALDQRPLDLIGESAAFFKACSDSLRLEILRVLARDSYSVLELCTVLNTKQSATSHHLKILANAGLVASRREGNSIFYHRAPKSQIGILQACQDSLFVTLDQTDIKPQTQQFLTQVQTVRASSSQHFFTENAYKFREQQDLIATQDQYADSVLDLLDNRSLAIDDSVLEIGPGEGTFLTNLADRFKTVSAIDNSQEMLNRAATFVEENKLNNVNLIYGDTKTARAQTIKVDCAICNMVLHHVPSPAEIFTDVSQLLNEGGSFFVTDLCSHDQSWVKQACGDLWLGFEPSDLTLWAKSAGFDEGKSIYLALRNGFRIQVRQFNKLNLN